MGSGLYEWLSQEAKDIPSGDMTGAWNDRKPEVLTDLAVSSTSAAILANEAIIVTTHPNEGLSL
jgi:hypothetical protein